MKTKALINVDWLSISCRGNIDFIKAHEYFQVKKLNYSTEHFAEVFEVKIHEIPYCIISCTPHSLKENGGIFEKDAMIVKIDNAELYREDWVNVLYSFLDDAQLAAVAVSRIDIAMDFREIMKTDPQLFIYELMSRNLRKCGGGKFTTIGRFERKGASAVDYDYLRVGSSKSDVQTYMYNKSRELEEVADKPWIRERWEEIAGGGDVWRLEVSIKGASHSWIALDQDEFGVEENGYFEEIIVRGEKKRALRVQLIDAVDDNSIREMFFAVIGQTLCIRKNDNKNITRCTPVVLFDNKSAAFKRVKVIRRTRDKKQRDLKVMALIREAESLGLSDAEALVLVSKLKRLVEINAKTNIAYNGSL